MLFTEEDGCAFFLVGSVLDIDALIVVSVVYIRAGASPLPHYVAKLLSNGPPGSPKARPTPPGGNGGNKQQGPR